MQCLGKPSNQRPYINEPLSYAKSLMICDPLHAKAAPKLNGVVTLFRKANLHM